MTHRGHRVPELTSEPGLKSTTLPAPYKNVLQDDFAGGDSVEMDQ